MAEKPSHVTFDILVPRAPRQTRKITWYESSSLRPPCAVCLAENRRVGSWKCRLQNFVSCSPVFSHFVSLASLDKVLPILLGHFSTYRVSECRRIFLFRKYLRGIVWNWARENHVCCSWNSRRTQRLDSWCVVWLPWKTNGHLFQWSECKSKDLKIRTSQWQAVHVLAISDSSQIEASTSPPGHTPGIWLCNVPSKGGI